MSTKKIISILLLAAFPALGLAADPVITPAANEQFAALRDVAQKAVSNNPEVVARWHNFKASVEEVGVARGGYLPKVDLMAGVGRESLKQPPTNQTEDYNRNWYLLSLNQMLFDGFATSNEVKRLGKATLVRYYELLDASENVALEAARAYIDVLRYRFLVNLAEDNYVQHRATFEQLLRRTQSGAGRRVDLEQAASRLAQAEVNLTTETANLHDVTARYQRLVDNQPPRVVYAPALLSRGLPASQQAALEKLLKQNPALLAAQQNIEAAQYDLAVRKAAYLPRFDFRARTDNGENYLGIIGDRVNNVAEVVMTYNLFNGGSDVARERMYAERKNMAVDMRDKACRDTRQTLSIAYNDVIRLRQQVSFLNVQVGLLEKTRDAYRDQFNIGQRTLLDLLDTENELLSARRGAINADMDLTLAYLRTYAGMGSLLEFLELKKLEVEPPEADQLNAAVDGKLCAAESIAVAPINRDVLNARALALLESNRQAAALQTQNALAPADASQPVAGGPQEEVAAQVRLWVALVARRDFAAFETLYAPSFVPAGGVSRSDWASAQKARFAQPAELPAGLQGLKVRLNGLDRATADFRQFNSSDSGRDATQRKMEFVKVGGKWLIDRETSVTASGK